MNNSVLKFWNGTRWVYPYYLYPKIWNGTQWVQGIPKSWSGTAWNGSSGGGGGGALDTWTLTVGSYPLIKGGTGTINGYNSGLAGTLSPATSSVFGGASVGFIEDINGVSMFFGVNSTATQAQFTTLTVNGTVYSSSAATFTWTGSLAEWNWTEPNGNPFPAVGQTCIVTLT
jgi:hypothetical protein